MLTICFCVDVYEHKVKNGDSSLSFLRTEGAIFVLGSGTRLLLYSYMDTTTNTEYLEGIANNDFAILQQIYKHSLPEVIRYIKKNSGTVEDAKDVFQEGILAIFKKVGEDRLVLTTPFHAFLFMVCKRIWLKKLKRNGNKEVPFEGNWEFSFEEDFEEAMLKSQKWALFNQKFAELTIECQQVLKMLFNKNSSLEIADKMGYTEDYAKRKKYKCKLSLTNLIKKDSTYKKLIE